MLIALAKPMIKATPTTSEAPASQAPAASEAPAGEAPAYTDKVDECHHRRRKDRQLCIYHGPLYGHTIHQRCYQ